MNFSLALGCQISEAEQPIQLPTPDNGELEAKWPSWSGCITNGEKFFTQTLAE